MDKSSNESRTKTFKKLYLFYKSFFEVIMQPFLETFDITLFLNFLTYSSWKDMFANAFTND